MRRIGENPRLSGYYADAAGRVRLVEPVLTWDDSLDLAFTEITVYGASSASGRAPHSLAAYDVIEWASESGRRCGPACRRDAHCCCPSRLIFAVPAGTLRPDPLGLG